MEMLRPLLHLQAQTTGDGKEVLHPLLHPQAQTTGDVLGAPGSNPLGRNPERKPQLPQLPQQPQRSRVRLHPGASGHMFPKTQTIAKNTTTESRRVRPSCRGGCAAAANAADGAAMKKTRKRQKIWRTAVWIHL